MRENARIPQNRHVALVIGDRGLCSLTAAQTNFYQEPLKWPPRNAVKRYSDIISAFNIDQEPIMSVKRKNGGAGLIVVMCIACDVHRGHPVIG